jgi:RNA polymerase sigma-70 factor (ECF subfamily)
MSGSDPSLSDREPSDEELMRQLAAGEPEALTPLHLRYAALIFSLAARSLDAASAEEIVQDVFVTIWQKAATFDPARGAFRSWALQITHRRILNELRHRQRRPQVNPDPEGTRLDRVPDEHPEPDEAVWQAHRRSAIQEAVKALPPKQAQALSLAFFSDLTHEQVADYLHLPLGTAKTRIRTAQQKLRFSLAPLVMLVLAMILAGGLGVLGIRYHRQQVALQRNEQALHLVTTSDVVPHRLTAEPGVPAATHATYRGRPGANMAVMTFSNFAPAPEGRSYQAWVRHDGTWSSLGIIRPDSQGSALLIAEGQNLAIPPEALQVTLEPARGSPAPTGQVIVAWPTP